MSLFEVDDTLTVRQLSVRFTKMLRREFSTEVWVKGQIRNLSRPSSGHVYFDLVEPVGDGQAADAMIKGVLFRTAKEQVNRTLTRSGVGARIEDGMEIRVRAAVDWYAPSGSLQLKMSAIDPEYTLGRLAADRDQLMKRLATDNLLDANGRLDRALVPLRIGVVTASGSAAWADFENTLNTSPYAFSLRLVDARMQGVTAPESIARAVQLAALGGSGEPPPDVVCIVRGGGARTDLAVFDSELVARAIATCPVPVICGVGHEIDRSVADEVAAISRKTPTACAQELIDQVTAADARFAVAAHRLETAAHRLPQRDLAVLDRLEHRLRSAPERVLSTAEIREQHAANLLQRRAGLPLAEALARIDQARHKVGPRSRAALVSAANQNTAQAHALSRAANVALRSHRTALDGREAQVRLLDPANLLRRGWSITTRADGSAVRSAAEIRAGHVLTTRLIDGEVTSEVTSSQTNK